MSDNTSDKTILIVDDDRTYLETLEAFLKESNYNVVKAASVANACEALKKGVPDLLLVDLDLGGETGIDLLKIVRKSQPKMPVIINTGKPVLEAAIECMRIGANDFLAKPIDPKKMLAKIAEALNKSKRPPTLKTIRRDDHGRILGGYKVVRTLGAGNQASVLLAEKVGGGRKNQYALKILKPIGLDDDNARIYLERFMKEAEAAAKVKHPNIIRVVEYGTADEEQIPFIVMEYLPGRTLRYYIQEERQFSYRQKAKILMEIADALDAIHACGIVHRDIKPENIIVDESQDAKLTDFGIAKLPDSDLTLTKNILGTPNYLSPEAFMSSRIDHRSDIFSFGVTAYELYLRKLPFRGRTLGDLAENIRRKKPREPRKIDKKLPMELQIILGKMIKKHPGDRYQSASEIAVDIAAYLNSDSEKTLSGFIKSLYQPDWS